MGRSKAWLDVGGETFLARAVRTLSECTAPIIVCAAPGQALPQVAGTVIRIDDEIPGRGPLAALQAALRHANASGIPTAVVLGVDLPLFTAPMAELLLGSLRPGDAAVVPLSGDVPQPLAAAYRTELFAVMNELIRGGVFSLQACLNRIPHRALSESEYAHVDPHQLMLLNINTREAYGRLQRLLTSPRQIAHTGPDRPFPPGSRAGVV
jgi:molybdopterin-guanine dinucleotide biosynthesis protein A